MATLSFTLKLVSPAFIAGIDKNRPEMRAASIRGQLRYWLRAMIGAESTHLKHMWDKESAIFGSTDGGSAVTVRVYRDTPAKSGDYAMLPHRSNEGRRQMSIQAALNAGQNYDLQLVSRPGVTVPKEALMALKLWSLLGGIGRRSRRMFGAVQITAKDNPDWWYPAPANADDLAAVIREILESMPKAVQPSNIPDFPTLHPANSWVIVGKTSYASSEDAVISLFRDLLRIPVFIDKEATFGQAIGGRRASPLIAQVRRIEVDGEHHFYPVLTALRSRPDRNIDWQHLKRFMEAAERYFSAERVWGGW